MDPTPWIPPTNTALNTIGVIGIVYLSFRAQAVEARTKRIESIITGCPACRMSAAKLPVMLALALVVVLLFA